MNTEAEIRVKGMQVTSCLVLAEAAKRRESTHRHTPLGVGEFEVATGGGIWVAIGGSGVGCRGTYAQGGRH